MGDVVVLLPSSSSTSSTSSTSSSTSSIVPILLPLPLTHAILPNKCIIFPGSFDPLHEGHVSLLNAAIRVKTSSTIVPETATTVPVPAMTPTVFFEMSLTNADKPPMNPKEVQRRMQRFISYVHDDTVDRDVNEAAVSSTSIMPNDWGILLTSHPLFVDKVKTLRHCLST